MWIIFDIVLIVLFMFLFFFERLFFIEFVCIDEWDKLIYFFLLFVLIGIYIMFIVIVGFFGCFNW